MILMLMIHTDATEAADRRQICLLDFQLFGVGASIFCHGASDADSIVIDTSCLAFEPIRYSRTDTEETRRRVREHNAAWDKLCKAKK